MPKHCSKRKGLPLLLKFSVLSTNCVIVVAADAEAARALGAAYRPEVPLDGACRLFGRDAVAFKSFEHMLDDAQSKQAAWALLKKLPRFGER